MCSEFRYTAPGLTSLDPEKVSGRLVDSRLTRHAFPALSVYRFLWVGWLLRYVAPIVSGCVRQACLSPIVEHFLTISTWALPLRSLLPSSTLSTFRNIDTTMWSNWKAFVSITNHRGPKHCHQRLCSATP